MLRRSWFGLDWTRVNWIGFTRSRRAVFHRALARFVPSVRPLSPTTRGKVFWHAFNDAPPGEGGSCIRGWQRVLDLSDDRPHERSAFENYSPLSAREQARADSVPVVPPASTPRRATKEHRFGTTLFLRQILRKLYVYHENHNKIFHLR